MLSKLSNLYGIYFPFHGNYFQKKERKIIVENIDLVDSVDI